MPPTTRQSDTPAVHAARIVVRRNRPRPFLPAGDRLTLEAPSLFHGGQDNLRRFIARAFLVPEVRSVVLLHDRGTVRIELSGTLDPIRVWRRLGLVLRDREFDERPLLDTAKPLVLGPFDPGAPVRVFRAGDALTLFRVRSLGPSQLRIFHPLLRRRDVRFRVRETLIAIHGVTAVGSAPFRAGIVVSFDPGAVEVAQIVRQLDLSWPHFVAGFAPPSVPVKLGLAGGLLALSTAAQFFNPALLPWATAAAVLYSAPNLVAALRDLARGRVGLPALYSAGLGFLLWSRLPFASSVMATLSQAWPALAHRLAVDAEHKLFAEHRRRLTHARRLEAGGSESVIALDRLDPGDLIVVRAGEHLPADGVVAEGTARVDEHTVLGGRLVIDKGIGERVFAGTFVEDGAVAIRVSRTGDSTALAALAARLPHGALTALASSREAERVANRNAKPALALAAALLLVTRTPRLSQVTIRPDYATAPRLSAHLSALAGLAHALSGGVLLRDTAVIDRLRGIDLYVLDDALDFGEREISVGTVRSSDRIRGREALALASAAYHGSTDPRAPSLAREAQRRGVPLPPVSSRRRHAGAVRFLEENGGLVTVGTFDYVRRAGLADEAAIASLGSDSDHLEAGDRVPAPVVVLRGRDLVGIVHFARRGGSTVAGAIAALRLHSPQARFVHLSALPQETAERQTFAYGFDAVFGDLDSVEKAETIRSLGGRSIWIGDGTDPASTPSRLAAHVSVSVAGLDALSDELADIVLLRGELHSLVVALAAADRHAASLKSDYRLVYLANLAALAGGFLAGFGSLRAGLVSNGGTATVFLSRWRALRDLSNDFTQRSGSRRSATTIPQGVQGPLLQGVQDHGIHSPKANPLPAPI